MSASTDSTLHYITGTTALVIPSPNTGFPALWYTASLKDPDSWKYAGSDYVSTYHLIGDEGIWDATAILSMYGYEGDQIILAASHERAVFDLLIHYCVMKGTLIPNIQASDIDDIVCFDQVKKWLTEATPYLPEVGLERALLWLVRPEHLSYAP